MKHNFSKEDLEEAITHAHSKSFDMPPVTAFELLFMLDALPEPVSDEWQECGFEDIREGDRVKVVDTHEAGDQTVYEGDVVQVSKGLVVTAHHQLHSVYNSKWYRIPAPVQHPDPAKHPVILVTEYDVAGKSMECEPTPFFAQDGVYKAHDGVYKNSIYAHRPDDVLSWSPAKVVAADE